MKPSSPKREGRGGVGRGGKGGQGEGRGGEGGEGSIEGRMPSSGGRGRQETVSCEERAAAVLLVLLTSAAASASSGESRFNAHPRLPKTEAPHQEGARHRLPVTRAGLASQKPRFVVHALRLLQMPQRPPTVGRVERHLLQSSS